MSQPSLFHDKLFPHAFQPPHLVDESLHDDDGHHREKLTIFLYTVNLEDDEPLVQQVDVLRGVEQEVVTSAPVILPHGGEHIVDVEVGFVHLDVTLSQLLAVVVTHILVKGVERRHDAPVSLDTLDVGTHGTAQFAALGLCHLVVLRLPECQQQGLDAVLLLHVEDVIIGVERVERYGLLLRVGEIHAVRSACLAPDHRLEHIYP